MRKKNVESWSKEKKNRGHLSKNRRPPKPSHVSILFSFHFPLVVPFFYLFFLFLFPCCFNHPFHCSQWFIKRAEKMLSNDKFPGIVVKKKHVFLTFNKTLKFFFHKNYVIRSETWVVGIILLKLYFSFSGTIEFVMWSAEIDNICISIQGETWMIS